MMEEYQETNCSLNIKLIGYCEREIHEIARLIRTNRLNLLRNMKGEYTIVYTKGRIIGIIK